MNLLNSPSHPVATKNGQKLWLTVIILLALNMAAARVVHVVCSEYPGLATTLRKQLHRSAELSALVTVKDVDPDS